MATKEQTDGDRVRALLKQRGQNARWLAKEIRMDNTALSMAMSGKEYRELTASQKIAIAVRLDVPFDMLFKEASDGKRSDRLD